MSTTFDDLNFDNRLKTGLKNMNYVNTTEVQAKTIPLMIEGNNVICKSFTGSGKTLAFGIPLSDRLLRHKSTGILILGPTRELVVQVRNELVKLNRNTDLRIEAVYGGHGIGAEILALKRKVDVLCATPGRLLDHIRNRNINTKQFDTVILDEADRMLDMGFIDDMKEILNILNPVNTHLFSATLDGSVAKLIDRYIPKYEEIIIAEEIIGKNILEKHVDVKKEDKFQHLLDVVKNAHSKKVLVFVSTKRYADSLTEKLINKGINVASIHGDKSQMYREMALRDFKSGRKQVLIATDVAARGLQIDNVEYVVNYDAAKDADTHKHRIGRTGRMGKIGYAINFISEQDHDRPKVTRKQSIFGRARPDQKHYEIEDEDIMNRYYNQKPVRRERNDFDRERKPFDRNKSFGNRNRRSLNRDSTHRGPQSPDSRGTHRDGLHNEHGPHRDRNHTHNRFHKRDNRKH